MLTVCAFVFSSCKKSSITPKVAEQSISLKFNGTAYTSPSPNARYFRSQNSFQIMGNFGTKSAVYVVIPLNFKVGSFDIATNQAGTTFFTGANLQDTYMGTSGTVVITSFTSTTVAGTFEFASKHLSGITGTVTSGQFQANYSKK